MTANVYVVKLGGKLYVQSELYSLYQATTKDLLSAHFFRDYDKALKIAQKAHGEVVELTITDGEVGGEVEAMKLERDKAKKEAEILKASFAKLFRKDTKDK